LYFEKGRKLERFWWSIDIEFDICCLSISGLKEKNVTLVDKHDAGEPGLDSSCLSHGGRGNIDLSIVSKKLGENESFCVRDIPI